MFHSLEHTRCLPQHRLLTAGPGAGSGPLGRLPATCFPEESGFLPSPIPRGNVSAPLAVLPENALLLLRAAPLRPAGSSTRSAPRRRPLPSTPPLVSRRPLPREASRSRACTRHRGEGRGGEGRGEEGAPGEGGRQQPRPEARAARLGFPPGSAHLQLRWEQGEGRESGDQGRACPGDRPRGQSLTGQGRDGQGRDGTGRDGTGRDGTGREGKPSAGNPCAAPPSPDSPSPQPWPWPNPT